MTGNNLLLGDLVRLTFRAGWYAYVGSAFGPGGLRGRLKHHISPVQKTHWHIDYLRQVAPCRAVWYLVSETAYEHIWAAALGSMPGVSIPVLRFGASDCRCEAHLFHFSELPDIDKFRQLVKEPVECWRATAV